MDQERINRAVKEILGAIGDDETREGLRETPRRIAEMYGEIFEGLAQDPVKMLGVTFDSGGHQEMVILKDIPFYSMCEHHFLPFHGVAHVGYIPKDRVAGVSKIARVVETLARRPQMQERLTSQIADTLMEGLQPIGVAVVIQAEHLCMTMRGVKKPGSRMVTSANRGTFRTNAATRAEFFSLVREESK
ncbi:MAG: GTP cyclohydrolase I FolE [Chloroflexota bacterium]|nr:GTP cyclohydrolase I FolE [Chloroflexota bacterium]